MKIAAIGTTLLSCAVDPPYASAAGVQSRRGGLIVEVETDEGALASAVNLVAALHFAASIPNGLVLEWDQNPNAIRDELLKEPLRLEKDGTVKLSERPGLGMELDRTAVERYRVG